MGKSSDKGAGKAVKPEPEASKASNGSGVSQPGLGHVASSQSKRADDDLPVVDAPKLDGSEAASGADDAHVAPIEAAAATAMAAPPPRASRFALLAATIALAAGFGSFAGALTASGVMRLVLVPAAGPHASDASNVAQAMKAEVAELATIKSSLDGAARSTSAEFAKIADRLDRAERAEAEPASKLSQIADTVDRLDKRSAAAAPDTTGSITPGAPQSSDAKATDRIFEDWIVQDVRRGRATVENKYGSVFFVGPGSYLPRVGSVETVKRQDGQWVVVTDHGLITSLGR
jgi:hypothetical protein